jgi:dTDP-4-dehydrorhamnose 3,5-epimerase
MIVTETRLRDVWLIEPQCHGDHRGWFTETYSLAMMTANGFETVFIQDNHSYTALKGTLRGLHFQNNPRAQTKLVRCTRGAILDAAVDIRKGSPQFGQWVVMELTSENHKQLYIPKGFAHAFLTLTDDVEVQYKVDEYYSPGCDRSIRYNDPAIGIDWGGNAPILSAKDEKAPLLKDSDCNFIY